MYTDIVEYYNNYSRSANCVGDWKYIKVFVFDKKEQKIMFYNSNLHLGGAYNHDHYKNRLKFKGFNYMVRDFKKQIKSN